MTEDGRSKYPWALWQNGDSHTVSIFEFGPDEKRARDTLYLRARRTGTKVVTSANIEKDTVTFQFFETYEKYAQATKPHFLRDARTGHYDAKPRTSHLPPEAFCRHCQGILAPSSQKYGECMVRDGDQYTPKHTTTEEP